FFFISQLSVANRMNNLCSQSSENELSHHASCVKLLLRSKFSKVSPEIGLSEYSTASGSRGSKNTGDLMTISSVPVILTMLKKIRSSRSMTFATCVQSSETWSSFFFARKWSAM
ncbi:hypothetical protein PFISCL1PPCAC_23137, partial [Pristionchus fissidentatus]